MAASVSDAFAEETAVGDSGGGVFQGRIDPAWWVVRGPHGGYLAAMILRALTLRLGPEAEARPVRSFTTHFVKPPREGTLDIATSVEREGRSMTYLAARATQEGETVALSLAAFSEARDGFEFDDATAPDAPAPDEAFPVPSEGDGIPRFLGKVDLRWVFGDPPSSGSEEAVVGGWMRLRAPAIADSPAVACLLDAWAPAIFPRTTEPVVCPTVDLTMHFRSPLPLDGAAPDDFYLGRFSSKLSRGGFFEEDGELWSKEGILIAQSRQLALALPA